MTRSSRIYRYGITVLILILYSILFPEAARTQSTERYEFNSRQMGTLFRIVLYAPSDSLANEAAEAAFKRIEELDAILSDYKPDSELNRLSRRSGSEKAVPVSDPLFHVLKKAQDVSRKSDGAFDVTIGPFVSLWREMLKQENPRLPSDERLARARKKVDYRYVRLDEQNRTVTLDKPGMQLDLGGIAKGYALDEALRILRKHEIHSALVDGGGDIVVGEAPPGKTGWKIAVPAHDTAGSGGSGNIMLLLENRSVATSGDLYQHIEVDGTRYSHIIDPRTGLGLTDSGKVTIVAADGITADSYASAVSVLGPNNGLKLVEKTTGMEAYIERNSGGTIKKWESKGLEELEADGN